MSALRPDALRDLASVVGDRHVVTDQDRVAAACLDWTGRFRGASPVMVTPGSAEEVAGVITICRDAAVAVTVQGGNTGLVGGSVPLHGELLLSLRRLQGLEVEAVAGQATAGAGTTIGQLEEAAARHDWSYGVDLSSRDSATVGGTVATNAGGLRMLRYGATRHQLIGIEAVLGDGSVISHLGGLVKDNTGYDLAALLCGSEGTLGVVTAARLRLVPRLTERVAALLGFADVATAISAAGLLRRSLPDVEALELMLRSGVELVCRVTGAPEPLGPAEAYLLVEVAALHDPSDELVSALDAVPGIVGSAVATDAERRSALWGYRERHTDVVNTLGAPHKLDVTLPADQLNEFVQRAPSVVAGVAPGADVYQWGHVGDGNVHVNLIGLPPDDLKADEAVLAEVVRLGGSISAEHGIGTAKRQWLSWCRTKAEIEAFRSIKSALDPSGILSPAVLLPDRPAGSPGGRPPNDGGSP